MSNPTWKYLWLTTGLVVFMLTMNWIVSRLPEVLGDGSGSSVTDVLLGILPWFPVPFLLVIVYLAFEAARQVNVRAEWAPWEEKREDFRELVDDLAVDEDFGRYSPAEQLHLARYITFFDRGTYRSTRDAKKLARELAEQRGILPQYQGSTVPNVQDWSIRAERWASRSAGRTLGRLRADTVLPNDR